MKLFTDQEVTQKIKDLYRRLLCIVVPYNNVNKFPPAGKPNSIYVDKSTNPRELYMWDCTLKDYVQVGGGGGDASLWSTFPATSDVNFDDSDLTNVGNLTFEDRRQITFFNGTSIIEYSRDGETGLKIFTADGYKMYYIGGRIEMVNNVDNAFLYTLYNTVVPTVDDDETRNFSVGSRWVMRNGDEYVCTDQTIGAAVWELRAKADLVAGKVPETQLPSYVDDVINGYLSVGVFYEEVGLVTPITGETGKIYVDLLTEKAYRWSGVVFVEISSGSVQVNSDWNAVGGVAEILNKPTILVKTKVAGVSLIAANFTLNAGYYEYDYANVLITTQSLITVEPLVSTVAIVSAALFLPTITTSAGSAKLYCTNLPSGNMDVDIWILT